MSNKECPISNKECPPTVGKPKAGKMSKWEKRMVIRSMLDIDFQMAHGADDWIWSIWTFYPPWVCRRWVDIPCWTLDINFLCT